MLKNYIALVVTIIVLFFNVISGNKNKAISDFHNLSFTPHSRTFAIWGIIYSLLLYCSIANSEVFASEKILLWYTLSGILNVMWLNVFLKCDKDKRSTHNHVKYAAGILIGITVVTWKILTLVPCTNSIMKLCFGIYAAWTTVASMLNISIAMKENNQITDNALAKIVIGLVSVAPLITKLSSNINIKDSFAVPLTWIWAAFGIAINGNQVKGAYLPIITNIMVVISLIVQSI